MAGYDWGGAIRPLKRVMEINKIPAAEVLVVQKDTNTTALKAGDLIYRYTEQENIGREQIRTIRNSSSDTSAPVFGLLRNGRHLFVNTVDNINYSRDFIVPAELIDKQTSAEKVRQLYTDWIWLSGAKTEN